MTEPESPEEIDDLFLDDEDDETKTDDASAELGQEEAVQSDESDDANEGDHLDALFLDDETGDDDEVAGSEDPEVVLVEEDPVTAELRTRVASLEAELAEAQAAAAANHDRLVRKAADLENARRRHQREKDDLTRYASESVLKDTVPVLDDLQRALDHWNAGDKAGGATLVEGLEMVARKFEQMLARRGVSAVNAKGQIFNPQFHEAIQQVDDDSVPHNTVVQEFQRGYVIHERLLRPALVVVAQGGPVASEENVDADETPVEADESTTSDASGEPAAVDAPSADEDAPVDESEAREVQRSEPAESETDDEQGDTAQTEVAEDANVDEDGGRAEAATHMDASAEDGADLDENYDA